MKHYEIHKKLLIQTRIIKCLVLLINYCRKDNLTSKYNNNERI